MKKSDDFSEWYNEVIETSSLCDKRYPIKGMNIWTPYGWKLMQLIDELIRKEFDSTDHKEVLFPLLIPEDQFSKEKEHIKGFDEQVYWVTHAGANPLDIKLCLRPTSETAIYPIFKLWVRSHADLPLKIYQIVNVFRYETKQTRMFMRVREIHFFESHTCHIDYKNAEIQIKENLKIMDKLSNKICIPYIGSIRPDWDKFAGAYYTIGIDAVMPNARTLQIGGIHQYRDNFAKPFEITYEDENGEQKHVHQTTFGMSERLVGIIIAVHGDDKGLILPPSVAPYQVVIIPILAKGIQKNIEDECKKIKEQLITSGFRVHLDSRDLRPGNKYYYWEQRGVPLRIELGMKDIDEKSVVVVRRDTMNKTKVKTSEIATEVKTMLHDIEINMYELADNNMKKSIKLINNINEIRDEEKVLKMNWCGSEECGHKIEEKSNASILGIFLHMKKEHGKCIICGKETDNIIHIARTY